MSPFPQPAHEVPARVAPASRARALAALRALSLAALLAAGGACGGEEAPRAPPAPPPPAPVRYASDGTPHQVAPRPKFPKNVLLICIDTLRADALAPWAKGPPHMPLLSAEMARGVVFRNATATAPWTAPSVASILTGLLPSSHGAQELSADLRLVPAVATLGEMLGRQGYRVAAFTGGGWVSPENGMLQGTEHVQTRFSFRAGATLLVESQRRLKELAPWFVLLHTFEAHDPYMAPPPWMGRAPTALVEVDLAAVDAEAEATGNRSLVRRFLLEHATRSAIFDTAPGMERMRKVIRWFEEGYRNDPEGPELVKVAREAYEKGLARLDKAMIDYLRDAEVAGLLADTFVAIVGDHGEGFGEHGTLHHGRRVYGELVHVPMSIRGPGLPENLVVDGSVSTMDLVPTLLELCGLPTPEGIDGISLLPVIAGGPGRPVIAEERRTPIETGLPQDHDLLAVRDARHTWIGTRDRGTGQITEEAYDRSTDPGEEHPLPAGDVPTWSPAFLEAVRKARHGWMR